MFRAGCNYEENMEIFWTNYFKTSFNINQHNFKKTKRAEIMSAHVDYIL